MVKVEFESDIGRYVKEKRHLIFLLVIFVILSGVQLYGSDQRAVEGCNIMYSQPECRDGEIRTGFYNPNTFDIHGLEITVPSDRGENIYEVESALPSNETRVLTTGSCDNQELEDWEIYLCCEGECYSKNMEDFSERIEIDEIER